VVGVEVVEEGFTLLTVTENGYGKRTEIQRYKRQRRGGMGMINIKVTPRNGEVVAIQKVGGEDELIMITEAGKIIRYSVGDISVMGRNTRGIRLISLEKSDKVGSCARISD
jgi:DNA gyrase subunit A